MSYGELLFTTQVFDNDIVTSTIRDGQSMAATWPPQNWSKLGTVLVPLRMGQQPDPTDHPNLPTFYQQGCKQMTAYYQWTRTSDIFHHKVLLFFVVARELCNQFHCFSSDTSMPKWINRSCHTSNRLWIRGMIHAR